MGVLTVGVAFALLFAAAELAERRKSDRGYWLCLPAACLIGAAIAWCFA